MNPVWFPFRGTVTKRIGSINYKDWLKYMQEFLKKFDSNYKASSNIDIRTGYDVYGDDMNGELPEKLFMQCVEEDTRRHFILNGIKVTEEVLRELRESVTENIFGNEAGIYIIIHPNDNGEEAGPHAFGAVDFTNKRRFKKHIFFFAQGNYNITERLKKDFTPRNLTESMGYKIREGIDRYMRVERYCHSSLLGLF